MLETKLETALLTGRTIEEKLAASEKAQAQLRAELEQKKAENARLFLEKNEASTLIGFETRKIAQVKEQMQ